MNLRTLTALLVTAATLAACDDKDLEHAAAAGDKLPDRREGSRKFPTRAKERTP